MDATSPAKRRALAPLDANAISPNPKLNAKAPLQKLQLPPRSPFGLKRPLQVVGLGENIRVKKPCQEPQPRSQPLPISTNERLRYIAMPATAAGQHEDDVRERETVPTVRFPSDHHQTQEQQRPESQSHPATSQQDRSVSPDASSVFDNSVTETSHDTSQDTTITEPDSTQQGSAYQPSILQPRRSTPPMTREEARQKVESLRLRLGLANYKLQTGQADIPLERLQAKPMPGRQLRRSASGVWTATTTATANANGQNPRSSQSSEEGGERHDVGHREDGARDRAFGPNPRRIAMPSRMVRMSLMNRMRGASSSPREGLAAAVGRAGAEAARR
ncbi:hypothetical protein SODALDRAFT_328403 [Sodiomyces alkalinus F11]|uniref:Uncharacterized protein n=1 Tax=Sodiomyces alkalinus (strain CBS 110278 / VKM F-3762 / F11) TaxID=1314773 RepID=A0A3N2PNU2_SODAK|nr:hypothetical protein SODALDRAFT_328403 [Sodiomyces alkalinus F11]ROT36016.1 hypothetical protein SODALDRAFT_328403 [Sodiomyces alkalinus F11]